MRIRRAGEVGLEYLLHKDNVLYLMVSRCAVSAVWLSGEGCGEFMSIFRLKGRSEKAYRGVIVDDSEFIAAERVFDLSAGPCPCRQCLHLTLW